MRRIRQENPAGLTGPIAYDVARLGLNMVSEPL